MTDLGPSPDSLVSEVGIDKLSVGQYVDLYRPLVQAVFQASGGFIPAPFSCAGKRRSLTRN